MSQGDIVLRIPFLTTLISSSMEKLPPNLRNEINFCLKKYHLLTEKLIKEQTDKIMAIQSDMAKELRLLLLRAGEQDEQQQEREDEEETASTKRQCTFPYNMQNVVLAIGCLNMSILIAYLPFVFLN